MLTWIRWTAVILFVATSGCRGPLVDSSLLATSHTLVSSVEDDPWNSARQSLGQEQTLSTAETLAPVVRKSDAGHLEVQDLTNTHPISHELGGIPVSSETTNVSGPGITPPDAYAETSRLLFKTQDRYAERARATSRALIQDLANTTGSPFLDDLGPLEAYGAPNAYTISAPLGTPGPQGDTGTAVSSSTEYIAVSPLADSPTNEIALQAGLTSCPPSAPCAPRGCTIQGDISQEVRPERGYPDEYLCDGGDSESHVRVGGDWALHNLDTEDTIGHYDTLSGRVVVQPSNRVCIYAPRFAATRQVTAAFSSDLHLQAASARQERLAITEDRREATDLVKSNEEVRGDLLIEQASIFRDRLPGAEASQNQGVIAANGDISAHEDFSILQLGIHKQAEEARLTEYVDAAISWSHDAAVQVVLDDVAAVSSHQVQKIGELFIPGGNGPPKFRVLKTASVADAQPGDIVEFTLRFDNIGGEAIGNVTIVDNLTTRLEYVPDSESCTLDAIFMADNNDAESVTVRWEITDPLPPGQGGIIRFRCRVR